MRLPHTLLDSRYFLFPTFDDLINALGGFVSQDELIEMRRLNELGLPPVTSTEVLGTMFGLNPGIIWSFQHRAHKHYRTFEIKKGKGIRRIDAPRVGLKIIQKWISHHLEMIYVAPSHVYGFVSGRSHVSAAAVHCEAVWVYKNDITNFFPSTPKSVVRDGLIGCGFREQSSEIIASLCCLRGFLAQGAPSSPVISNITFSEIDKKLADISRNYSLKLTRYADDIVFSGRKEFPPALDTDLVAALQDTCWRLSADKKQFRRLPERLKVHGLLVHGENPRLTKGYRNRIRLFKHIMGKIGPDHEDYIRFKGHINYDRQVAKLKK